MDKPGEIKISKVKDRHGKYWEVTKESFIKWRILKRVQIDRKTYLKKEK
ncbi:MAG: hypothetical protein LBL60_02995 [Mycoplasmataceae bacterium]|jgi:hypothetical protein|nr:hypothetical protein [Mycoplasmataceae bacterium]